MDSGEFTGLPGMQSTAVNAVVCMGLKPKKVSVLARHCASLLDLRFGVLS